MKWCPVSKRLSEIDWLKHGMAALAEDGPPGLTVEAMCARAGKTRGSFYHHFESAAAFQKQLMLWWQKTCTRDLIDRLRHRDQSEGRLDHLNLLAAHLDPRIERAFRDLAAGNKEAAIICRSVDDTRIGFLAELYEQSPRYSRREAQMLARIEYAAWVGLQLVIPEARPQEMLEMYQSFLKLTGRG